MEAWAGAGASLETGWPGARLPRTAAEIGSDGEDGLAPPRDALADGTRQALAAARYHLPRPGTPW